MTQSGCSKRQINLGSMDLCQERIQPNIPHSGFCLGKYSKRKFKGVLTDFIYRIPIEDLTGERRRSAFPQHNPIQMIVRAAADAFEKPMINIFQNLGTISFSRTVRHCSVMMGCNFQKYILASLGFLNVSGKRRKREVCVPADSGHKR